jgi:predicted nucleotidyltransferase
MRVRKSTKNVAMLGVVAQGLAGLKEKVVFVGGATIDLYLAPGAPESRATDDVDCVVEIAGKSEYYRLESELRALGFQQPLAEKGPICRWKFRGVSVDVMPTEGAVLGFENRWYREGMAHAEGFILPDGREILAFSVPYLIASKLEAFRDRGRGDYIASPDLEDVVALLDGCADVEQRLAAAPAGVREYVVAEFGALLDAEAFLTGLDGNLGVGPSGPQRVARCLALMRRVAGRG